MATPGRANLAECTSHKLIADVALIADGKVLLVKYRDTAAYDGEAGWFLPDGAMKEPEHPDSAAARILYDQAGVKARGLDLGLIESFGAGTWHLIFHYRAALAKAPRVKAGPNVARAEWFALDALPPREECAHHGWAHDVLEKIARAPTSA